MRKDGMNMSLIDKDRYKTILQQAIRMVTVRPDADLMCRNELDNMRLAYEDAMACLERMPDALIRCKECRFGEERGGAVYCTKLDYLFKQEWYCGDAERNCSAKPNTCGGEQDESN